MNARYKYFIIALILLPVFCLSETRLKIDNKKLVLGEVLNYKASWGRLTIGEGSTIIDNNIYKIGSSVCYKIKVSGQTNGFAKLFYVRDNWVSYIDTATLTTLESSRSIREGGFELDEQVYFDHVNKKAKVKVFDKKIKSFTIKDIYDTPENIRDVVAGFVVFRLLDFSRYATGDTIPINGFYQDEGYNINVIFQGKEQIKTEKGEIQCYKMKPLLPKNKIFKGKNAVQIWLSTDTSRSIVRIKVNMFIGNVTIELQ